MPQKLNPDLTGLNDPLNSIGVTYLLRFWLSKSYKRFRQPTFVFWYLLQVVYGLGGQLKKFILKRSHWQTPLVIPVPIIHHFDRPSLLPKCKNNSWMPSYWIFCTLAISYAAWKVSVFAVILVRIFPYSDWIRRDTPCPYVFSPNSGKYGPE